jgi:hypothetical protein
MHVVGAQNSSLDSFELNIKAAGMPNTKAF